MAMAGVARQNILSFVLVGLVRTRSMYGYEMHQALERQTALGLIWHIKQPHLYSLLTKLEADGWLVGFEESNGTRPPRRILRATRQGEAEFDRWLATPVGHGRDFRQEFMAQLYFAQQSRPDAVEDLVARQTAACRARRDALAANLRAAVDRPYDHLVYAFRLRQMEMIIDWLALCPHVFAGHTEHPLQ